MAALAVFAPRVAALLDRRHGEGTRPLEPACLAGQLEELEEGIAISRGAMAEVRSLGEWPGAPDELAGAQEEPLQPACHERRIGEARHDAGRAMAPLHQH